MKEIFERLAEPFALDDIEWRAGATNKEKTQALALAYITSRAVMDRLDEVVGPENWKDQYYPGPSGGVLCGLSIRVDNKWITKWDGAENTEFESVKGGLSDAFKRAGYKWGIGRYLYKLESKWVACEVRGKYVVLKSTPQLPAWALPAKNGKHKDAGSVEPPKPKAPNTNGKMSLETAQNVTNSKGKRYGDMSANELADMSTYIARAMNGDKAKNDPEHMEQLRFKQDAVGVLLNA